MTAFVGYSTIKKPKQKKAKEGCRYNESITPNVMGRPVESLIEIPLIDQ